MLAELKPVDEFTLFISEVKLDLLDVRPRTAGAKRVIRFEKRRLMTSFIGAPLLKSGMAPSGISVHL